LGGSEWEEGGGVTQWVSILFVSSNVKIGGSRRQSLILRLDYSAYETGLALYGALTDTTAQSSASGQHNCTFLMNLKHIAGVFRPCYMDNLKPPSSH